MSCDICGDYKEVIYCERYDTELCLDCISCNLHIEKGHDDYCRSDNEDCEYRDECKVIKALKVMKLEDLA